MPAFNRQLLKRYAPRFVHKSVQSLRSRLSAPPIEELKLHDYELVKDTDTNRRLSLVIPTIAPGAAFGGVLTGLDLFLETGQRTGAEMRVILDDFGSNPDRSVLDRRAQSKGLDPKRIEVIPRLTEIPRIAVRSTDLFMTFNWWVTLNVKGLLSQQRATFGVDHPYIYIVQDYEPQFYPFSSTHLLARAALDHRTKHWVIVNSKQLFSYYSLQGHSAERTFIFEPVLSASLKPFLGQAGSQRRKQILVYGRPNIARNCFPAIRRGLDHWIRSDAMHDEWSIVSAGEAHKPVSLAGGRQIESLGKLSLEDYARLLNSVSVGISLMASPHPSYPPLEMAHFGIATITNAYTGKNLSRCHENIISVDDISQDTLARAISEACTRFGAAKGVGSAMPGFLRDNPFDCLDPFFIALENDVWGHSAKAG